MHFRDTPQAAALREEIRAWLRDNLPAGWGSTVHEPEDENERARFRLEWERRLYQGGWSGVAWPREYGGRGLTQIEYGVFLEEMARADAPEGLNIIGRNLAGPVIMAHGTAKQKERFIPAILKADEVWCQGFSEPDSGSDLASVRTRIVRDGDHFVINGQKIWTSFAQFSQWCFLLGRTDPDAVKHKGLSFVLIDMRTPGITIRPLVQITGETEFNEVFFDNVRVPVENLVGELNQGWRIAMSTLRFERGPEEAMPRQVRFKRDLDRIIEVARRTTRDGRTLAKDAVMRQKIAASHIELELVRLNGLRAQARVAKGQDLGAAASTTKLYWSHMAQRLAETAMELGGEGGALMPGDPAAAGGGLFALRFLQSRAMTIYSGTSEIQRNIIAEQMLGLPK
jgi:alkylation response protein AidB-like acyl-CoA dehydrogenase